MTSVRLTGLGLFLAVVLGVGLDGELIRNEGLRARLAAEALARGEWLVPHLYGEPHLTKPPGMTALIAACSLPFGQVTPLSARLPSVVAAVAVIALFGWSIGRWGGPAAGLAAAAILPCCPFWLERVPSAEIDLVQLAWVSGSLLSLLRAVELEESDGPVAARWGWWLAALLCVGGGLVTKWTAPAFFYLTAVPWLLWRGRLNLLLRPPHLAAVALVGALAGVWVLLVAARAGWEPLLDTVRREALLRLSPGHHPRPYPWSELATFPLSFVAGCLPWSLLAVPALSRPPVDGDRRRLWQLCVMWLATSLLFWTIVPGHRPRHILPAQPAVAGLAVLAGLAWAEREKRLFRSRLMPFTALATVLVVWLAVKLAFVGYLLPARLAYRQVRAAAAQLAARVPPAAVLHLGRLKDEGLLFYYDPTGERPVRRVADPTTAAPGGWCLLTQAEWQRWPSGVTAAVRAHLHDGQGDPLVLVQRSPLALRDTMAAQSDDQSRDR